MIGGLEGRREDFKEVNIEEVRKRKREREK